EAKTEQDAPSNAESIENALLAIWKELLQVETVSPTASFFDLGGHSMLAVRMLSRIRASMAIEIPLRVVFKEQTIEKLATWMKQNSSTDSHSHSPPEEVSKFEVPLSSLDGPHSPNNVQVEEVEFCPCKDYSKN